MEWSVLLRAVSVCAVWGLGLCYSIVCLLAFGQLLSCCAPGFVLRARITTPADVGVLIFYSARTEARLQQCLCNDATTRSLLMMA